jgi:Uma2 family endonuclease
MTVDEFLDWEERQELRHEFDGVDAVAMTGGTAAHSIIQTNLAYQLTGRLAGTPCRFFGSDFKTRLARTVRYADGIVVCGKVDLKSLWVTDPVVIFEVLSRSTAHVDLGAKNREYEAAPSVRRYVILDQDEVAATQFARVGDDWVGHILRDDAILSMPEIGVELPLRDLYQGIDP